MDPLVTSQRHLYSQIKKSHRFFTAQLVVAILYLPLIVILAFFMRPYMTGEDLIGSLVNVAPMLIFMVIISIRPLKETYSYFRTSNRFFSEIEYATDPSQITRGLTAYVNQLMRLLQSSTLFKDELPTTNGERIERIDNHLKKGLLVSVIEFIVSGMVVLGLVMFLLIADPALLDQFSLYLFASGFFIIPGIRTWLFIKWRPLVKKWLLGFQELVMWGTNLEQLFLQQHDLGGREP